MSNTTVNQRPGLGNFGPVRFSYMSVFKVRQNPEGDKEFSVVLLIPKVANQFCPDPKAVGRKANELIQQALQRKFGEAPPKWDTPLLDGDQETDNEGKPKFPGYWYVRAKADEDHPPLLIDGQKNKVSSGWNSGDWGIVQVNFYGYEFKGKKGVGAGLRAIQFLKHDEALGGGGGANLDEFEVLDGDTSLDNGGADGYDPFAD